MKKFLVLAALLFSLCCSAQVDSLSYVTGYLLTEQAMKSAPDLFITQTQKDDFLKGVEDSFRDVTADMDSTQRINFEMGEWEGSLFLQQLFTAQTPIPLDLNCMIEGLRKVGDTHLNLPQDTIEARILVNQYPRLRNVPDSLLCTVSEAIGIFKGLPNTSTLRQYLDLYNHPTVEPDTRYFAKGQAHIMEATLMRQQLSGADALTYGKTIGWQAHTGYIPTGHGLAKTVNLDRNSVIAGVRAALGYEPCIIDPKAYQESLLHNQEP